MKKIVALYDIHYPYNINLKPVIEFIKDFKPDTVILGGDSLDLAYLSHWNELSPGKWQGSDLLRDYEEFGKILDTIRPMCKDMFFIMGNHEKWVTDFGNKFPTLKGIIDIAKGLKFKERNIKTISFGNFVKIGHLFFMHGASVTGFHSKKMVGDWQRCVRYGHVHDFQAYSLISPIDTHKVYNAISCGCLCKRNPEYLHNRPNKWQHGFYYAIVDKQGNFTDSFVPIIRNKFYYNDKEYK